MALPGDATHSLANHSAPDIMIPESVIGFVDLTILADIQRCLRDSENLEDLELADWIKSHYLHEPTNASGRPITTTEGFSQLDRAYRRVRSLTGKAQEKWPFFDRNWKEMAAATVRNNSRGEVAPGVRFPNSGEHTRHKTTNTQAATGKHSVQCDSHR